MEIEGEADLGRRHRPPDHEVAIERGAALRGEATAW
jgi:hypothetical protein